MLRKVIVFLDACMDRAILLVCLVGLVICAYATYDAAMVYFNASDTGVLKFKPTLQTGSEPLRELSRDAVAWLTIDGTNIDYPVMQGKDNVEYVNKDPYGDFSLSGSIFLDSRNAANLTDPYSLLYGHHMEYGAMFGALDEYADADYLVAHRTGVITTVADESYAIRIFASMKSEANDMIVFDPTACTVSELLAYVRGHADVYSAEDADANKRILALSTCTSADSLERTVVFGTLAKA